MTVINHHARQYSIDAVSAVLKRKNKDFQHLLKDRHLIRVRIQQKTIKLLIKRL